MDSLAEGVGKRGTLTQSDQGTFTRRSEGRDDHACQMCQKFTGVLLELRLVGRKLKETTAKVLMLDLQSDAISELH